MTRRITSPAPLNLSTSTHVRPSSLKRSLSAITLTDDEMAAGQQSPVGQSSSGNTVQQLASPNSANEVEHRMTALPALSALAMLSAGLATEPYLFMPDSLHASILGQPGDLSKPLIGRAETFIDAALARLGLPQQLRPDVTLDALGQQRWWRGWQLVDVRAVAGGPPCVDALQRGADQVMTAALTAKEILPGALATFFPWTNEEREELKSVFIFAATLPFEYGLHVAMTRLRMSLRESPHTFFDVISTMPALPEIQGSQAAEILAARFDELLPIIPFINDPGHDFERLLAEGHLTRIFHIPHDAAVNYLFHFALVNHRPSMLAALMARDPNKTIISLEERPEIFDHAIAMDMVKDQSSFCAQLESRYGADNAALFLAQASRIAQLLKNFLPHRQAPAA